MAKAQLDRQPLCVFCLRRGLVVAAEVADHVKPHHGEPNLFWFGALQSLCMMCHSGAKQQTESRGYSNDIDDSGWPIDPRHPANAGRSR